MAAGWFLVQADVGFDVADEGFFWYGVEAVLRGEVPLRDFQAYDPGRYYWSAAWSRVFGRGLVALRLSTALFQALSLCFALVALRRVIASRAELAVAAILLGVSMPFHYKHFETGFSVVAVYVALRVLEHPSRAGWAWAGVFTGLSACFGRNLGLYNALAFLALLAFQTLSHGRSDRGNSLLAWAAGALAGYAPVLAMTIWLPGFGSALRDAVLSHARVGATNLPLPVPWPWTLDWGQAWSVSFLSDAVFSVSFLGIPCFYAWVAWRLLVPTSRPPVSKLTTAASFVGVFYLHYAFSRADATHLSFAIPPFLMGVIGVPTRALARRVVLAGLALLALPSMALLSNLDEAILPAQRSRLVAYSLRGDTLRLSQATAFLIQECQRVVRERLGPGESVMFVPYLPGLYPALDSRSPIWEIYTTLPAAAEAQRQMIRQMHLHQTTWVMVFQPAVDARRDLGFRRTHPLVWRHLQEFYRPVPTPPFPPYIQWFRRKEGASP